MAEFIVYGVSGGAGSNLWRGSIFRSRLDQELTHVAGHGAGSILDGYAISRWSGGGGSGHTCQERLGGDVIGGGALGGDGWTRWVLPTPLRLKAGLFYMVAFHDAGQVIDASGNASRNSDARFEGVATNVSGDNYAAAASPVAGSGLTNVFIVATRLDARPIAGGGRFAVASGGIARGRQGRGGFPSLPILGS